MISKRLVTMVEVALMAAIAVVLNKITPFQMWLNGGSVTLSMIPVAAVALRRGIKPGVVCGGIAGLILLLAGGYVIHPVQAVLDYPVAFAALGFAGLAVLKETVAKKRQLLRMSSGIILGGSLRFLAHYLSGIIFFKAYTPVGQSLYVYSFIYNLSYILPEVILTVIVTGLIYWSAPQLLRRR
ncbi:energy-coupled thiamine transporter ThiT [Thermoactinomyces mirandus]|uniref:Energy-coupled thiamine transporter ThiT n=1 Tax=Thermoactinomyces mirandus TaxID=2756294 RepID=A0A7W1XSJ9_9BACL|nr:energy-coupled thiamine transporter ThiT [Thermoactinomyces mirandus]MBA4602400.1 energy-coupled thiamine transporter ThiT [Thermoactinomyces mirandus]